jgi:hypothetical protein
MRRATYQAFIGLRVPNGLPELIDAAAGRTKQSAAAYVREAVIERLERDGLPFDLGKPQDRPAPLKAA